MSIMRLATSRPARWGLPSCPCPLGSKHTRTVRLGRAGVSPSCCGLHPRWVATSREFYEHHSTLNLSIHIAAQQTPASLPFIVWVLPPCQLWSAAEARSASCSPSRSSVKCEMLARTTDGNSARANHTSDAANDGLCRHVNDHGYHECKAPVETVSDVH